MSQSDLYDFFSYVARDGKSTTDTAAATSAPVMARRTSIISSTSSSDSDSSAAPTPLSTTTTTTRAPPPMPSSSTRLTADEITARILASPEHHALCEMISGRHDHDDDYARRSADKYRAFVDLAARLEAQKMPTAAPKSRKTTAASAAFDAAMMQHQQHDQARREWNSLWW